MRKLQKFITLNIQLLFHPNFLHWMKNFFLFNMYLKCILKEEIKMN